MSNRRQENRERGSILLVVAVFLATAIAALAGINSSRVVQATRSQRVMEQETRAFNSAYAQIHMAMNVVNNSAYNELNQNLSLRRAIEGLYGGTIAATAGTVSKVAGEAVDPSGQAVYFYENGVIKRLEKAGGEPTGYVAKTLAANESIYKQDETIAWLDSDTDPLYGVIANTNVRVYKGRDYIKRLARLKGNPVTDVDPGGISDSYYVLEAAGRVGDTIRLVSALVRENEPFSSFVFFQNRATLGVSGAPRGLIHSNDQIAFYFKNGNYVDSVSAVNGFDFLAGATKENTNLKDANPAGARIDLEQVDFAKLKGESDLFVGQDGLDARMKFYRSGKVRIKEYTPPRYEQVQKSYTYNKYIGFHYETYTVTEPVQTGTTQVAYDVKVVDYYKTETYTEIQRVLVNTYYETRYRDVQVLDYYKTVTKYKTEQVQTGTKTVTKYRTEDVFELQTVTKTRRVKVWVPFNQGDAGGGTSVGGGGAGDLGEWVWQDEQYQVQENVKVGTKQVPYDVQEPVYKTVTTSYTEQEPVYKTVKEAYQKKIKVYEDQPVEKTRQVPVYKTVTKYKTEPVYTDQTVEKTKQVNDYEPVTVTWTEEKFFYPVWKKTSYVYANRNGGGTIYVDGAVTRLYGSLNGRLSIVANKSVRVTGNIKYVDDQGDPAMLNGTDYTRPYERNKDYQGNSVLGVIARDDILFTRFLPKSAEVNGTLMAVNGRVGVDGFWADAGGELHKDSTDARKKYLTPEQQEEVRARNRYWLTKTRRFTKDSLRRIGGIISNNRVMETYITTRRDGTSRVSAGFKRGSMRFDINLLFNPPPNFVEVPRPVLTYFVPILMIRSNDS